MEQSQKLRLIQQKLEKSYKILKKQDAKYKSSLIIKDLGFLQYYMIPQKDQFQYVYRPGDDSFFMLSVLKRQIPSWNKLDIFLQLGSGSGILSAHVNYWLKELNKSPLIHISIDINPDASTMSSKYYNHYNLQIQQITTSLFKNTVFGAQSNLNPEIIIFNPPYIPVEDEEIQNQKKYLVTKIKNTTTQKVVKRDRQMNMIAYSYMGGLDGLQVTRKMLKSIDWNCWVYFIVMEQQYFIKLQNQIKQQNFWKQKVSGCCELMQFMKYQNQDLFLIKMVVQIKI